MDMMIRTLACLTALSLAAACNPTGPTPSPAKPEEQTPVASKPAEPATADEFTRAANFECQGGGKVDVVFSYDGPPSVLVRIDGGASMKLPIDASDTSGMAFKDATTTIRLAGNSLGLIAGGKTKTCNFVSRELLPPPAAGVVRTLTVADAGASVEIKVGEKVAVALSGIPTAGYVWAAASPPAFVKVSEGPSSPTTSAQMLPGFTGGNHWEVTLIEGLAAGEGEIVMAERRPWEDKAIPAAGSFKFKLKVK
jgi:inhibitor of cysteine peptidase